MAGAKRFRAVLEPLGGGLGWVVARLPFDVATTWKKMIRLRVTVETAGRSFVRPCSRPAYLAADTLFW